MNHEHFQNLAAACAFVLRWKRVSLQSAILENKTMKLQRQKIADSIRQDKKKQCKITLHSILQLLFCET